MLFERGVPNSESRVPGFRVRPVVRCSGALICHAAKRSPFYSDFSKILVSGCWHWALVRHENEASIGLWAHGGLV